MRVKGVLFVLLLGSFVVAATATPGVASEVTELKIGDGSKWHCYNKTKQWIFKGDIGGKWQEGPMKIPDDYPEYIKIFLKESKAGVTQPPVDRNLHSRAFYTAEEFTDFTAEFEFHTSYRDTGTGAAGLIIRGKDANHFYAVYFPWCGQQLRADCFWTYVLKAEGDGYLRSIKEEWVPGVPIETERWYKVRVEVKGSTIDVWVDGRRAISVETDGQYKSGAVGLLGYGMYFFRDIKITGKKTPLKNWAPDQKIPLHNMEVGVDSRSTPSALVAPNGDILLAAGKLMVRSKDKGRTWGEPEKLPEKFGTLIDHDAMFCTSDGRMIVHIWRSRKVTKKPYPEILISESTDNGYTWSDPVQTQVEKTGWPEHVPQLVNYGGITETADGTLLCFLYHRVVEEGRKITDKRTWSAAHFKAFATRSTDGGKSWSGPIELDQPTWWDRNEPTGQIPRGKIPGSVDFTEPSGVAIGNTVTVLIRPIYSATMWQCWSYDAGATWDAASRTTFPGYAQSMLRLKSGPILCAHRFPQHTVNISYDDGLNWDEGTIIDYPAWANGCMVEVEPGVVLCATQNFQPPWPLLVHLFRVTPEGIQPISR